MLLSPIPPTSLAPPHPLCAAKPDTLPRISHRFHGRLRPLSESCIGCKAILHRMQDSLSSGARIQIPCDLPGKAHGDSGQRRPAFRETACKSKAEAHEAPKNSAPIQNTAPEVALRGRELLEYEVMLFTQSRPQYFLPRPKSLLSHRRGPTAESGSNACRNPTRCQAWCLPTRSLPSPDWRHPRSHWSQS